MINQKRVHDTNETSQDASKLRVRGCVIILFGFVIILAMILVEEKAKPFDLVIIMLKLGEHLGVAAIIFGLVAIIMEVPHWQKYFQERLAKTVIEREYLKTLSKAELISLQTDTLKAFFEVDEIDREESFLDYFHTKIRGYIGSPYREDTTGIITISDAGDKQSYVIEETISYKCRKVGNSIQDRVSWITIRQSKVTAIEEFRITVEVPQNFYQAPDFQAKFPTITSGKVTYDIKDKDQTKLIPGEKGQGYTLLLADFREIDGLYVEVHVKYTMSTERPMAWNMTHPSKNLSVTINFPPELTIDVNIFGLEETQYHEEKRSGLYVLRYDSWLLPDTGLSYHFLVTHDAEESDHVTTK